MKYAKEVEVHAWRDDLPKMQIGQWVNASGARGQYLGTTKAGNVVVAWFPKREYKRARSQLRRYAKLHS